MNGGFAVTFFTDFAAQHKREERYTLAALASRIQSVTAAEKARLPWLKLARFGELRSEKNSLRHDDNILAVSGIEADYDGERMSFEEACERLTKAGIEALVYTSPSHTEDAPRWRVLCPVSEELLTLPTRAQLVGRLNGLFGGILAGESFTLSQAYYFGSIKHSPSHRVHLIEGTPLDQHDELDEIWRGKPETEAPKQGNGPWRSGPVDESALRAAIVAGDQYHLACTRLVGKWAQRGVAFMDAQRELLELFDAVPEEEHTARWRNRRADVPRIVRDIYGAEAEQQDAAPQPPEEDMPPPDAAPPEEPPLPFILRQTVRLSDWQDRILPPRGWIVPEWIPSGRLTGVYGAGGVNKTDFGLQLLLARSAGLPFLGHQLEAGPSYGVFCEDELEDLLRRATRIAAGYKMELADFPDCHFVSLVGVPETEFVTFDGPQLIIGLELRRFDQEIVRLGAGLAVLDTIADTFGGNENSRREVSQFCRVLDMISMGRGCGIVATAHPSVRGRRDGSLDSGSSAWRGKVRSRLTIHDPGAVDDDAEDAEDRRRRYQPAEQTDRRIVTREKSNYAKQGEQVELVIKDGFFVPAALDRTAAALRGPARDAACDAKFLELLAAVIGQGGYLHDQSNNSSRYAPKVFARRPDGREFSGADYSRAMRRLFVARRLRLETVGPPSRTVRQLVIEPEGGAQ